MATSIVYPESSDLLTTGVAKKRVLIITPVYPPNIAIGGGVAVTYGALTAKLEKLGHQVQVLSPRLENLDYGKSVLYKNFPVIFPTLANVQRIVEATDKCDVVVCPDDCGLIFYAFIACWKNKPLLFNMHTNVRMVLDMSPDFILRWIAAPCVGSFFKVCSHLSTRTMTTSPSYHELLVSTGHRCDGVFSPRIKTAVFEQDDSEDEVQKAKLWLCGGMAEMTKLPILLYAGRLSHEKRIRELVAAKPAGCVLSIVGDGPEANVLFNDHHDPANGVFVLVGMQDQSRLRVLYKASDYLVSASKFETLGMTVLESHLCGTPVAVQKAPGFVSQVTEGKNGFFINYDDAAEARSQMEEALRNKPTKAMIAETVEARWDGGLEELDNVVVNMATEGRPKDFWMWMWPVMIIFFFIYSVMSFPFNTLTNRVVRTASLNSKKEKRRRKSASRRQRAGSFPSLDNSSNADDVENHPIIYVFSLFWLWVVIQPLLSH